MISNHKKNVLPIKPYLLYVKKNTTHQVLADEAINNLRAHRKNLVILYSELQETENFLAYVIQEGKLATHAPLKIQIEKTKFQKDGFQSDKTLHHFHEIINQVLVLADIKIPKYLKYHVLKKALHLNSLPSHVLYGREGNLNARLR